MLRLQPATYELLLAVAFIAVTVKEVICVPRQGCPSTCSTGQAAHIAAADQYAQRVELEQVYTAWNGANWFNQQLWLHGDNHCDWTGVACCTEQQTVPDPLWNAAHAGWTTMDDHYCCCDTPRAVVALFLPGNNVSGDISVLLAASALANSLLFINLEGNHLSGSVPQGVCRFSQLKGLHLADNNLQGSVHESLQDISDTLISLDLSRNSITGTLPASIFAPSSSLEVVHLDDNLMHGDVPLAALTSMPQRLVFTAARNHLSGSLVMPELADLNGTTHEHHESLLQVLDLTGNRITGTLPPSLMMVHLAILGLSHNSLTGTIPNTRCQVLSLRLSGNQLHGSLPEAMATWSSLELDFSFNRLTGQLPCSMQYMESLGALRIRGNSDMTGTVPEGLIRLQTLMLLDIRNTNLQEPAPVSGGLTQSTVPPWLQLATVIQTADSSFFHEDDDLPHNETIVCPAAQVRTTSNDAMLHLLLDPLYYHFEGCLCSVRHQAVLNYSHGAVIAMKCIDSPLPKDPLATIIAAVVAPLGALGACLLLVSTYVWVRYGGQSALTLLRAHIKRQKPPQAGHQLVLVLTDIAGSTELWEWDSHIAAVAVEQHDHLLRQYLADFCGYEVTTEGDAFLVAFHDPTDAVCYCLAVQVALQGIEWSEELLQWCQAHVPGSFKRAAAAPHTSSPSSLFPSSLTAVEAAIAAAALLPSSSGGMADAASGGGHISHQAAQHADLLSSLPSATQLFRGLRVRMSVATGTAEKITLHKVTSRVEYPGSVTRRVQAMADAPEGGQVLIDGETFKGLGTTLGTLGKRVMKALKKHEHCPVNPWELPAGRCSSVTKQHAQFEPDGASDIFMTGNTFTAEQAGLLLQGQGSNTLDSQFDGVLHQTNLGTSVLSRQAPRVANLYITSSTGMHVETSIDSTGSMNCCDEMVLSLDGGGQSGANSPSCAPTHQHIAHTAVGGPTSHMVEAEQIRHPPMLFVGHKKVEASVKSLCGTSLAAGARPCAESIEGQQEQDRSHQKQGSKHEDFQHHPWSGNQANEHEDAAVAAGSHQSPSKAVLVAQCNVSRQLTSDYTSRLLQSIQHYQLLEGPLRCSTGTASRSLPIPQELLQVQLHQQAQQAPAMMLLGDAVSDDGGVSISQLALQTEASSLQGATWAGGSTERYSNCSIGSFIPGGTAATAASEAAESLAAARGQRCQRQLEQQMSNTQEVSSVAGHSITTAASSKQHQEASTAPSHHQCNALSSMDRSWSGRMIHSFLLKIDTLFSLDGNWTQQHAGSPGSCRSQPSRRWRLQRQHSLDSTGFGHSYRRSKAAVAVVDMGIHKLAGVTEPVHLLTILPPGLEARAHFCPPINSLQQYTPGYFNAPGTTAAPLQVPKILVGRLTSTCGMPGPTSMCPLPPVVMVFCAIDQYQDMLSANREAAEEMLQQYSDVVRWTLLISGGYECQEQEGSYMIVFASAAAALEWSLLVQEALMEVLDLPGAGEVLSAASGDGAQTLQFRGPRVRIGLYKGVPARITPHTSTGRADYFGQLVNRAARYCHTAAHGGQVVASRELIDELMSELSGVDVAQLSQTEGPPWALHADVALAQADHDVAQVNWGRPRMAGRTASFASSMAGRGSDNGGLPAAAATTAASPCYGGRRGTAETITAASDGAAASSDSHRKLSSGSAVLTLQQASLLRISSQKESRAAGHGPLGRFGSSFSTSTVPSTKPKAPLSGRQSFVMGMGINGMQLMPDVSALLIMRKAAADTPISSGMADDGKKGSPAVQLAHGMKQLYAAALDIDYGLASGLYARLMLHKWKWAELLLVHDLGQFTFKGISGSHSLVAISTKALAGRQFPHNLRKAKGERLVKGKGLLYKVHMQPSTPERMCSSGQLQTAAPSYMAEGV